MKQWKIRNDFNGHFINGMSNLTFRDMVKRLNLLEIENVLLKASFVLNNYPEGNFWELEFSIDQVGEQIFSQVCKAFKYNEFEESDIALQCSADFSRCIFCIDGAIYEMEISDFIDCVEKLL